VLAAVTIPAHAFFLRLPWAQPPADPGQAARTRGADRSVLGSRTFLLLVTAATLCAFAQYAALVSLVPLLTARGLTAGLAAWALGLGGAGQVAGRLSYRRLDDWLGTRGRTVAIIAAVAATTLLLGLLPGPAMLLVAASVLAGAVRGVFTLTEAPLVADHWGPGRYAVNGVFNAPLTAAQAIAPSIGAAVAAAVGSYPVLFVILAAAAAAGASLAAAAPPPPQAA
jgi:predicted MFS family arabinose efflux permease